MKNNKFFWELSKIFVGSCLVFVFLIFFFYFSGYVTGISSLYRNGIIKAFDDDIIINMVINSCENKIEYCNGFKNYNPYCYLNNTEIYKVYCVNEIFSLFYKYNKHNGSFNSPSKTIIDGGVCRDAAIFYCSIFKKMDINCRIDTIDNYHGYNIVWSNDYYCKIDQEEIDCKIFKNE